MNEGRIVLKLKIGENEVQLEGLRHDILEMLENDLSKIVEGISKVAAVKLTHTPIQIERDVSFEKASVPQMDDEPYPSVQAKSCGEAVVMLLSTPWGRRKPRSLSEIKSALDVNALHYSSKVIGFTLTRLIKRQKLRRWKTEGGFVYTVPT